MESKRMVAVLVACWIIDDGKYSDWMHPYDLAACNMLNKGLLDVFGHVYKIDWADEYNLKKDKQFRKSLEDWLTGDCLDRVKAAALLAEEDYMQGNNEFQHIMMDIVDSINLLHGFGDDGVLETKVNELRATFREHLSNDEESEESGVP